MEKKTLYKLNTKRNVTICNMADKKRSTLKQNDKQGKKKRYRIYKLNTKFTNKYITDEINR